MTPSRSVMSFVWGLVAGLLGVLATPVVDPILSVVVPYLGPVVIGAVAAFLGRGVVGLLATIAGVATSNVLGVVFGRLEPPLEGETASRIATFLFLVGIMAVAYAAAAWMRGARDRRADPGGSGSR